MHYIKLLPDDNSFVDYLICIDTKFADKGSFTLHKTYELHEETMEKNGNDLKYIIADDGIYWLYDNKYFVTIEEWRELQINKII